MRTIALHIGMPKTGSTTIQHALSNFQSQNTSYLKLPPIDEDLLEYQSNHSGILYLAYAKNYKGYYLLRKLGYSNEEMHKKRIWAKNCLEVALTEQKSEKIIISAEGAVDIDQAGLLDLKNTLDQHSTEINVYAYIREPISFITSATQELIKDGYRGESVHSLNYRDYFEKFEAVFSKSSVHYREFSKRSLLNSSILEDFANWTNTEIPKSNPEPKNSGLSLDAIKCIYALNRSNTEYSGSRVLEASYRKFKQWIEKSFPGEFRLPANILHNQISKADLDWMQERIKIRFPTRHEFIDEPEISINLVDYLTTNTEHCLKTLQIELEARKETSIPNSLEECSALLFSTYLAHSN